MHNPLLQPVRYLKGVGPKKAAILNKLEINTIEDLVYYFPRRYEDRAQLCAIKDLEEGQARTIKAVVLAKGQRRSWRRPAFNIFEASVSDDTGRISCVWFNQPYLKDYFSVGATLILYGKVERYGSGLQMTAPEFEVIEGEAKDSLNIGRIVPVYSLPQGLTQRAFRRFIKHILEEYLPRIKECLPFDLRAKNNLLNLAKSLIQIHFPDNLALQKEAFRRLAFEEFFFFQLLLLIRKARKKERKGVAHKISEATLKRFKESLSFRLTVAQEKAVIEISADMARPRPMQRLLQGDVGSGKTIVALIASLIVVEERFQVAFMVPTEVLAKQHFEKIGSFLSGMNTQKSPFQVGLLASSLAKKEKDRIYRKIKNGGVDIVIGTHALLESEVQFKRLGLVVIDEQHKFGVGQRALLPAKGAAPDVLIMTATPIPRTLAITLYGDLDISVINEMPAGRMPIETMQFPAQGQNKAYAIAKEQVGMGHQVFIVYPVIEESYTLDIAGAEKMYKQLRGNEFKDARVGLIHGRLSQREQDEAMQRFKNGELDVLVSTTILEVGIDIPNATCIVIEHAERFGLSQLHQLRGRVGRGPYASYCILISDAQTVEAGARLEAMVKYNDGFKIAEEDLKIRGPGEFFGKRQSGLSELKIGNPLTQMQLLKKAREEAIRLFNADSSFSTKQNLLLKERLAERFPEYDKLMEAG